MNYIVWTKDEYEGWQRKDCGDLPAVQREVLASLKDGHDPVICAEIPFEVNVKIKEEKIGEIKESQTRRDKGPGAESKGKVRSGDTTPVPELDQGSGDTGAGDRVPGK